MGTAISTTPKPMKRLLRRPSISVASWASTANHSTVKHSKGDTRGKAELLKADTLISNSGPNR